MPKAGRYDYSEVDLDDCIERLEKVHSVAKQDVVKREVVADILGMKHKSGWFNTVIGAMSQYGLVETREGEVRITELTKTILYGEPSEVANAKAEAVRNIELFNDLFNQYGLNVTDEQLRIFLRQKAYVDVSEVQSLAEKIGKLYKKVASHLTYAEGAGLQLIEAKAATGEGERVIEERFKTGLVVEEYKLGEGIEIKLPKDKLIEAWEKAKKAMDIILGVEKSERE